MDKVQKFFEKIWSSEELKKKLGFTLLIFFLARLLASVPLPMIDTLRLQSIFAGDEFLSLLNIIAGGTLATFSLVAVGISPYITASIVMQLLTLIWPKLKEMQKDGPKGQAKLNQYTRFLTLPVALTQSFSIVTILKTQQLLLDSSWKTIFILVGFLTVGAFVMLWLGELITAHGLGNGISMLLLLGILSQIPMTIGQVQTLIQTQQWFLFLALMLGIVFVIAIVVFINQAVRKIPIHYAKRIQGNRQIGGQTTFFPLKLNTVGVMPIIFAVTMMSLPAFIGRLLASLSTPFWQKLGESIQLLFAQNSWSYALIYFVIVFVFSYFSALLFFNTRDISDELKKSGAFIPGIRPGQQTQQFFDRVLKRLTFVDGIFLGSIAVMPFALQVLTGMGSLAIGGTSLLIAVSVILEVNKVVEGAAVGQNYDKYL